MSLSFSRSLQTQGSKLGLTCRHTVPSEPEHFKCKVHRERGGLRGAVSVCPGASVGVDLSGLWVSDTSEPGLAPCFSQLVLESSVVTLAPHTCGLRCFSPDRLPLSKISGTPPWAKPQPLPLSLPQQPPNWDPFLLCPLSPFSVWPSDPIKKQVKSSAQKILLT